ncbi:MAG: 3'-5' exonuclease [Fibrobacter sp.]|nr:3'-5' exonuclease [Fibrobacter sp.]MDY6369675.1 3'-5' exonuclease [Fibrobacter sp.]MDY6389088.1 3'-5' exonuclease [Fibrobacter sp.]
MEAAPHFAVVDVETTGGKPEYARIIEIGIVLVDDWKITQKFDSLVKVPVELSPFIQNLTGITPKMLYHAPEFDEIAPKVDAMLEGRIFVAHNVASDYGAVGAEMKRSGFDFSPERLCTVKLSRRVFPGLPKYSLHELSMSLGLPDFGQHRALNDAIAAANLLIHAKDNGGLPQIEELLRGGKRPIFYPKGWTDETVAKLPRTPGIAYFVGRDGILFATAARNVRTRVVELLSNTRRNPLKGFTDGIYDIRVKELGSELLAKLCLESELSKKRFPCNAVVQKKPDIGAPLPDMAVFLPGRFMGDRGVVIVQNAKVQGYAFLQEENGYQLSDILERMISFSQTDNLVPILRGALERKGIRVQFLPKRTEW